MAKYKLTLNTNDNTSKYIEFEIPDEAGTYELWFQKEGFGSILVGDVVVDGKENIYNLKLGMSDGKEVDAGTFTTPIIYCTLGITPNNSDYGSVSQSSIKVPYGSTISSSGNKITVNGVTITATEKTDTAQYDYSFSGWSPSSGTVTGSTTITANFARATQTYTLTITSKPTGVATHTVYRNGVALANGATIYYGDVLTQSATAASGYNAPSVNWSSITVTGNVTATAIAGSAAAQWRTIGYSAGAYSNQVGVTNIRITAYAEAFAEEPIYDACGSDIIGYVTAHAYDSGTFTGLPCSGTLSDYDSNTEEVIYDDWNSTIVTAEAEAYGKVSGTYSNNVVTITATGDAEITKVEVYK